MNRIETLSKAEVLKCLEGKLTCAKVLPQIAITVGQFEEDSYCFLTGDSQPLWLSRPVIVRSSSRQEDTACTSNAGKFESILNVTGKQHIKQAIAQVIDSYETANVDDQVFIQPMVTDVTVSGVAFSRDPNTGGHYHVINYDDSTNSTSSVTDGSSNNLKLAYVSKGAQSRQNSDINTKVVALLEELETVFSCDALDIEFALDKKGVLFLLQVRKLVLKGTSHFTLAQQSQHLSIASHRFSQMAKRHPYLLGSKAVFGIMPDWNPAEIIGTKPKPLSLSLYRELITDNIWAYQRDNYGYRKLRSFPLMVDFHGMPYIDARISFNSFIPASLDEAVAEKLVNHYINRLEKSPYLHDKVEFDIVFSCYSLDLKDRLSVLTKNGFSQEEVEHIFDALRSLSNRIIGENGLWRKDIDKIAELESRQATILESDLSLIEKMYWLTEDCKRYGTLPFAGLARAGFIAVQMLDSMVAKGILSEQDKEMFLLSLDTVSSGLSNDLSNLSKNVFLEKYGHLRPGTYDITSPRYDEDPDAYFNWEKLPKDENKNKEFAVTIDTLNALNDALAKDQIDLDAIALFNFIRAAIEGREFAKFIFTKSLSNVLSLFAELSEQNGFSKEMASYADINLVKDNYISARCLNSELKRSIDTGLEKYQITKTLRLPPLLVSESDFWQFEMPSNQPNYVTQKVCSGKVLAYCKNKKQIESKILFIENADPGYDWIFSTGIKGFVTQYGGINSHMAIRASELGIPAVIGAGETLYKKWLQAGYIEIDCANKTVRTAS